jgi:hypothetical protein
MTRSRQAKRGTTGERESSENFYISKSATRQDGLIIYGGKEIARMEKSLPNPATQLDEYDK